MKNLNPFRGIANLIKTRPREDRANNEQDKLSFNVARKILRENADKIEQAAASLQNADGALSILQAEVSELKNFCKELILYEHNRKDELQKLENMSRKYANLFQQLEIEIPALLSQISMWNEIYSRDQKNQSDINFNPQHPYEIARPVEIQTKEPVTS